MNTELATLQEEVTTLTGKLGDLKREIAKVIIGQEETVEQLLITFLAGGHALLEGVPGLAKTLMIRTLSQAIDLDFKRIQFTPDLMPSDIIGTEILDPIEQSGTFPLPEAQQDRFLFYIKIGYPTAAEETQILKSTTGGKKEKVHPVLTGQDILRLQELVREVPISDGLIDFVSTIVRATRPETTSNDYVKQWVGWGAGPRAGQAMILTAKARALSQGRMAVTLEDIKNVALPVLRHRVIVNFKAEAEGITSDAVTYQLLEQTNVSA